MDKIENLQQYEEAEKRVEELLPLVNDNTPTDDPNYIELVRLSNMVADYDEVHFSLFRNFDAILDAKYGKVGTPEREQFHKEVDAYNQAIEEMDKKIGLEKLETEEQYKWALNRIEELRPFVNEDTPCYDHNSVEKELLSFMIMDYEEEQFSLVTDFDEVLDARHGKVGTPERELFRKEGENRVTTAELFEEAVANIPKEVQLEIDWSFAISDKIAKVLTKKEMTQKMFAKKVDVTEEEVSKWLSGTHNFTLRTIARISSVLGENLINI